MLAHIRPAIVSTVAFTLLLGVAYPLAVTGVAHVAMPFQAEGSILKVGGKPIGSALLGQNFAAPQYLHPRPSAAGSDGYDASGSSGSNYGPLNSDLAKAVADRTKALKDESPAPAPADAVTASASGLDPQISPAYAERQASRISAARHLPVDQVRKIIAENTQGPTLGFLGQPAVNVLKTNLALDVAAPTPFVPPPAAPAAAPTPPAPAPAAVAPPAPAKP